MLNFFAHHSLIEGDYKLNEIKVMEEIGRGNSHVFTVFIKEQLYAMKQIQIKSDYEYNSFLRQISYMKQLSQMSEDMIKYQGYFLTLFEISQYNRRKYAHIVMQCAEMNLQNLISLKINQGKRFSKLEIIQITNFLLNAFNNLQKKNIAHCDIKPENILILNSKSMSMKICDVGSCRIVDGQSVEEATILGTVPFLAPELVKAKSKKIISSNIFKSDVFSFGLVILYVITCKKFSSKQRIQIKEPAYFQIISEWIKEARQIISFDSRIAQILRGALQFQQYKRPLFKDLLIGYQNEKKKKMQVHESKIKKLQFQQNQMKIKADQNYMSIPTSKLNLFRSRNLTTKISTRTVSIGFPKITRNYDRANVSPNQFSPGLSPLISKRQSGCFTNSSPQKLNTSTLDFKKIIYVTQEDKESIPFEFLNQQQKNFVFLTEGVSLKKADCVSIYQPCSLATIYQLSQVQANKLFIQYQGFNGVGVGSDCPFLKIKKIYANFKHAELVGGYKYLFKAFCGAQLQSLQIDLTGSDVTFNQVIELIDRLCGRNLKHLAIAWQNNLMDPQQHTMFTEKIAKIYAKKCTLIMNNNFIKYEKQVRWLLPKNCETLYLEYKNNFMGKLLSNLCISLLNNPIKQLYLNFSNNNINKSESNLLFKTIYSIESLQKLILNLSWNPIQDISYVISSLTNLKQVSSLQLKFQHTEVPEQQIFQAIATLKYLFDKNLKILKVAYNRNMRKEQFETKVEKSLDGFKALKIDVIGYDNKYFLVFIKKSSKTAKTKALTSKIKGQKSNMLGLKMNQDEKQKIKIGHCLSLYSNSLSFQNYLCIACSDLSQLSKNEYYCKFCIQNCRHKGHNIVKIYERSKCCCSYSGACTSEIVKRICAQDLKIKNKKVYECLKCERVYCQGCISRCQQSHKHWIQQNKQIVIFQCKTNL